jgi:pimeloyl-ACP methyl ester carboxylesterase
VVLLLSGSGTTDRDGNLPGEKTGKTDVYKLLAASLRAEAHVATLRFDDEGGAASLHAFPPTVQEFSFELEVDDAAKWIAFLRADKRFQKVYVAGHSQGSLTAILAAKKQPVDGYISLDGAGRPIGKVMHDQVAARLTPDELARFDAAVVKLEQGEIPGELGAPLDRILPASYQPYFASWMKYDPQKELAGLAAPVLVVHGKTDRLVAPNEATILAAGKPGTAVTLIEQMCHVLKKSTGSSADDKRCNEDATDPIADGLIPAIASFLEAQP